MSLPRHHWHTQSHVKLPRRGSVTLTEILSALGGGGPPAPVPTVRSEKTAGLDVKRPKTPQLPQYMPVLSGFTMAHYGWGAI